MEPAYVSAFAALTGSMIGGLTSLVASWLTQHVQFRAQRFTQNLSRREELYKKFIQEASRWYADAYEHDNAEVKNLVNLYALVSEMRILSSPEITEKADMVVQTIIEAYLAPNRTFRDIPEFFKNSAFDPLRKFGNACREELQGLRSK